VTFPAQRPGRNDFSPSWLPAFTYRVDVADFSRVESFQGLGYPLLIDRLLVGEQVPGICLLGIEAQEPADALGGLALVTKGVPADAPAG
jgi:hypothetical protein